MISVRDVKVTELTRPSATIIARYCSFRRSAVVGPQHIPNFSPQLGCLLEDLGHIGSIRSRDEIERQLVLDGEIKLLLGHPKFNVNIVRHTNDWNIWTLVSHLPEPFFQVLVRYFSCRIKGQNISISLVVVRNVQFVELILASCIPEINGSRLVVVVKELMTKQGESVR